MSVATTRASAADAAGQVGANAYSADAAINADGTAVAFRTPADNLDPRDRNFASDVFVRWTALLRRVTEMQATNLAKGERIAATLSSTLSSRPVAYPERRRFGRVHGEAFGTSWRQGCRGFAASACAHARSIRTRSGRSR